MRASSPLIPVILCGGAGTRLWPLSRAHYPKQYLPLASESSMLQETISRLAPIGQTARPVVVCNEDHRFIVAEQLRTAAPHGVEILLEPAGRNTAPAIAAAALHARKQYPDADPLLLVLAADHVIRDTAAFAAAVHEAVRAAEDGALVTFGITPDKPETGYGYIRADAGTATEARPLREFVEKPDLATAQHYVESGDYYWNSGMFLFRASVLLDEMEAHAPAIVQACRTAVDGLQRDLDFIRLDKAAFCTSPSDSIDYAVMEKTRKGMLVPLEAGWSDVGSWSALWDVSPRDEQGNAIRGDVIAVDSTGSYLQAGDGRLVATVGVRDLVVVDTADAVLVAHKDAVQDVKKIVERLKQQGRSESELHRKVYRPWGSYDSVDQGERYQVKRITVNPGARLSLQMHHHRAEHWIVVSGTASVRHGENVTLLSENQSIYIPLGTVHSLENPGKIPLELIEVQSGAYLGEDDIIRFEDMYGRQK